MLMIVNFVQNFDKRHYLFEESGHFIRLFLIYDMHDGLFASLVFY